MPSLIHEPERTRKPWRVDYWDRGRQNTRRFATKREAQALIGDLAKGTHAAGSNMTLRQWVPRWVETHGLEWEARTVKERTETMDTHILPTLGPRRLRELSRRDVREWRGGLIAAGVTPYRAQRAASILSTCLGDAVDDDLIGVNPCVGLRALTWRRGERRPIPLDDVELVRAWMEAPRDRAAVSLMAYAGLRPNEVLALQWEDVQERTLVVRRGAGRQSGETKTGSTRTVPLIGVLADDLQALERGDGLVLGIRNWGNWTGRVWRPARAAAGVDHAAKFLRHTAASLWIAEGRTSREVAYLMGHTTPRLIEEVYGHLFQEAQLARRNPDIQASAAKARRKAARLHAAALREAKTRRPA